MILSQGEPLAPRAVVRELYVETYNRGYIIDRMAQEDFDLAYKIVGRIEIVEQVALEVRDLPKHFLFNKEEEHYAEWLKGFILGKSGNFFLRDQFLYGVFQKAS